MIKIFMGGGVQGCGWGGGRNSEKGLKFKHSFQNILKQGVDKGKN